MKVTMFYLQFCPYCRDAFTLIEKIQNQRLFPEVEFEFINEAENQELANQYDYYYVPSLYIGKEKVHEGALDEITLHKLLKRYQ